MIKTKRIKRNWGE